MRNFIRTAFVATSSFRSSQLTHNSRNLSGSSSTVSNMSSSPDTPATPYPELLVYDMDACLWDKEMYEMSSLPSSTVMGDLNGRGEGVVGVMSGRDKISLHKGSLISLQEHHDGKYPGMKIAMASSADTPFAGEL